MKKLLISITGFALLAVSPSTVISCNIFNKEKVKIEINNLVESIMLGGETILKITNADILDYMFFQIIDESIAKGVLNKSKNTLTLTGISVGKTKVKIGANGIAPAIFTFIVTPKMISVTEEEQTLIVGDTSYVQITSAPLLTDLKINVLNSSNIVKTFYDHETGLISIIGEKTGVTSITVTAKDVEPYTIKVRVIAESKNIEVKGDLDIMIKKGESYNDLSILNVESFKNLKIVSLNPWSFTTKFNLEKNKIAIIARNGGEGFVKISVPGAKAVLVKVRVIEKIELSDYGPILLNVGETKNIKIENGRSLGRISLSILEEDRDKVQINQRKGNIEIIALKSSDIYLKIKSPYAIENLVLPISISRFEESFQKDL